MLHEMEFRFLQRILHNLHLSATLLTPQDTADDALDMGIRRFLGQEDAYQRLFHTLPFQLEHNTIYKMTDAFLCTYLFLPLPQEERCTLLIGPYMTAQLSREQLLVKCWGYDYEGESRAVDTHIKRLREKLGDAAECIKTVIKAGYKLEV